MRHSNDRRAPADTPSDARRPASSQSPLSFVSTQRRRKLHPLPCSSSPLVATSSISFASAFGESSSIPLRLLSPQKRCFCGDPSDPLRWASAGAPFFCRLALQSSAPPTGACIWCSSLRPTPLTVRHARGPHQARRVTWAAGTKAYGCRRPGAVGGTGATAGSGRRKEKHAVQLSGGCPGDPPPGHALWVLSLAQEKVPRPPVREPARIVPAGTLRQKGRTISGASCGPRRNRRGPAVRLPLRKPTTQNSRPSGRLFS